MDPAKIIKAIDDAFSGEPRPETFIRGTCACEECLEHDETMKGFKPRDLPLEPMINPGWDPLCFASDAAFRYFMPGFVRLVLSHPDDYIDPFLNHLAQPDRVTCLSPAQARQLALVLDHLAIVAKEALDNNRAADELFRTKTLLEQAAQPGGLQETR
jgi:hypothetical protein